MIIIKKVLLKLIKSQSEEIPFKIFIFIYSFISLLCLIVFVVIYKFFLNKILIKILIKSLILYAFLTDKNVPFSAFLFPLP